LSIFAQKTLLLANFREFPLFFAHFFLKLAHLIEFSLLLASGKSYFLTVNKATISPGLEVIVKEKPR